jgi:hypothetical protein
MSGDDPNARLIPWYAAGTLGADESAALEAHLSSCDGCRDALALARGFRRLAPATGDADLFEHIQAQRLAEFAEDPAGLEPDARRYITNHIRACAPCAEALEILEDLGSTPAGGDPQAAPDEEFGFAHRARRAWDDLWRRLSRTVLRPGPAFAYLAALIVMVVALPMRMSVPDQSGDIPRPASIPGPTPAPEPAPAPPRAAIRTVARPIPLPEEVIFRDGAPAPAPLMIPLPAAGALVPLELRTSLEREDLGHPETRFRVTITQGDDVLFEQVFAGSEFDRRSRLTLLLDPAEVATGVPCRATIVRVRPGDPGDGEELFRRSFVLVPADDPRH